MRKRPRAYLGRIIAIAVLAIGIAAAGPGHSSRANASTLLTNVSVVVTTDMCPRGGSVHRVNVSINTPGTAGSNWSGNTVGGLEAISGLDQVIGSNFCQTAWWGAGYYWYWDIWRYFSFSGQHMYV